MRTIHNFTLQRKARFMLSNKSRNSCLALSLSLAFAISSTNTKAKISFPQSTTIRATALVVALSGFAGWIRLHSKGTSKFMDYKWEKDWVDLLKVWNIPTSKYWELVDKYVIGREFSLLDIKYTDEKDGKQRSVKDKWVKSKPLGAMGLIDAYLLIQLAKFIKLCSETVTAVNGIIAFMDVKNS